MRVLLVASILLAGCASRHYAGWPPQKLNNQQLCLEFHLSKKAKRTTELRREVENRNLHFDCGALAQKERKELWGK